MTCLKGITSDGSAQPFEHVVEHIAGAWAGHIKNTSKKVASQGKQMASGQATDCKMTFLTRDGKQTYTGSSSSHYHAEMHCLVQANQDGADLSTGTFGALSNPVCLVCATVLVAVGITEVPAVADHKKEYGNYQLPDFIFDDDGEHGILCKVLGKDAWTAWTSHLSKHTRDGKENRRELVTRMTQAL